MTLVTYHADLCASVGSTPTTTVDDLLTFGRMRLGDGMARSGHRRRGRRPELLRLLRGQLGASPGRLALQRPHWPRGRRVVRTAGQEAIEQQA